mgnify:CR=1 FL=1
MYEHLIDFRFFLVKPACFAIVPGNDLIDVFPQKVRKLRLQEAAIINLSDLSVYAIEKKYDVNGEKTNYFTYLFLKCSSRLSPKSKLSIVTKAVENVQNGYYDEI